jgi:hypothetical protein
LYICPKNNAFVGPSYGVEIEGTGIRGQGTSKKVVSSQSQNPEFRRRGRNDGMVE